MAYVYFYFSLFALGVIQITSVKSKRMLADSNTAGKYREAIYSIGTALGVIIVGFGLRDGLLPVFLISIMGAACVGQVIIDIKRDPHHRRPTM